MRRSITVTYFNKNGAFVMHHFGDIEAVSKFLATLKAVAEVSENGEKIGAVEYAPGLADDKRVKWVWWLEVG